MKVLVTGGAGFIGSHIVEHFQRIAEVLVLDNLRSGFKHNLAGLQHEFIDASICDRDAVRAAMKDVDFVFHLAAMVSVPESMLMPMECNETNVTGTLIVLEEAARAKVKKLIFSSSAAIYGDNPAMPKSETMVPEPKSPYAVTKLDGEYYCKMFTDGGGLATTCLRYFNVFGPRQNPKSQYAAAVPIFIEDALKNMPITIYGDGEQTRDFVYVKDVVAANVYFATQSAMTGTFNIGYGQQITINNLTDVICRLAESRSKIQHVPARPGDIKHSLAAIDKLRGVDFNPAGNFQDGLRATVDFFRKQTKS
ncbi:MAG TPA: NAD-dependent epimerase/dehydratase family protein [Verrucomicrobiae bacterium]|jgi:UDP-glucose 4-epimerase